MVKAEEEYSKKLKSLDKELLEKLKNGVKIEELEKKYKADLNKAKKKFEKDYKKQIKKVKKDRKKVREEKIEKIEKIGNINILQTKKDYKKREKISKKYKLKRKFERMKRKKKILKILFKLFKIKIALVSFWKNIKINYLKIEKKELKKVVKVSLKIREEGNEIKKKLKKLFFIKHKENGKKVNKK